MKVLLHPGGALFVMAGIAFLLRRFVPIDRVPLIGGAMMTVAFFAMIFGLLGGIFLTIMVRKGEASA
jgi:hypothetical protein